MSSTLPEGPGLSPAAPCPVPLTATEESYRTIFQSVADAIYVLDVETGAILDANRAACELNGRTLEEMRELGIGGMSGTESGFTWELASELIRRAAGGETQSVEWMGMHSSGRPVWGEVTLRRVTLLGQDRVLATVRNVTDRKAAEEALRAANEELERRVQERTAELAVANRALRASQEHFRTVIENSSDMATIVSADGRVEYISPAVTRVLGVEPEEMLGTSAFERVHPDDLDAVVAGMEALVRDPSAPVSVRYRFRNQDGSCRALESVSRKVSPDPAAPLVVNTRDVTERERAEEALRQAKAEAERANHAKSEFLSRMSHELRTPMNSILGFAQLLADADLGAGDRKAVQHILNAGEHLLNLINEVLDIARIEAGRAQMSLEPVRLDAVVREAVGMVRPIADARGVWVSVAVPPEAGTFVHADRQRLAQVLLNLLSNAVKYNRPAGQVRIVCEAAADGGGAGRVQLRVEDTGCGIPPGERDQLFVPFARLGAERAGIEGTGLGLALSRRLVEAMEGRLELEASTAGGSTFLVELRRVEDPAGTAATQARAIVPEEAEPRTEATLLYVEDNLANLSLIEMLLQRRAGWRLIPALQGRLGVELARQHAPDVVLLDLHLPDVPGEEVLRQLRADPRTAGIPVIVISADATPRSIERLREAGADDYLSKPLDVKRFVQSVGQMLSRRGEG